MTIHSRHFWRWPIGVGFVSALSALAILVSGYLIRISTGLPSLRADAWPLASDAWWYVSIAGRGYHAAALLDVPGLPGLHDFAFFPLWPALIRVGAPGAQTAIELAISAILGALGLYLLALGLWYRVLRQRYGKKTARRTILLAAWAPPAVVVAAGYSEPLYLFLLAAFFALIGAAELSGQVRSQARAPARGGISEVAQDRLRLACLLLVGIALGLTRASSLALLPALLLLPSSRRTRMVALAGLIFGLVAWAGYIAVLTGHLDGFWTGIPAWLAVTGQPRGLTDWLNQTGLNLLDLRAWVPLALPTFIGIGALLAYRRKERTEAAYAALSIGIALAAGTITSAERYVWPALFLVGPALVERMGARTFRVVLGISLLLYLLYALTMATGLRDP